MLAAVIGSFFYVKYSVDQSNADLAVKMADAARMKTAEEKNLESRILTVRQQLRDFSTVIEARKLAANFFEKFEELVFPDVYFTKCGLNLENAGVSLTGHADNFEALGRQVLAFQSATGVFDKVVLSGASVGEKGGVDFNLGITVGQSMVAMNQGKE